MDEREHTDASDEDADARLACALDQSDRADCVRRGPGRPRKDQSGRAQRARRHHRNSINSMRGFKRHRHSRDDSLDDLFDDADLPDCAPEEPPYFPEKWPGKICALCNLGERSQLGQGEMTRVSCDPSGAVSPVVSIPSSSPTTPTIAGPPLYAFNSTPSTGRRQKNINKCKTPSSNPEHTDELSVIGHAECADLAAVVENGYVYLHKACVEWSPPIEASNASQPSDIKNEDKIAIDQDEGARAIVAFALQRKCSFCLRFGASVSCRMSCMKYFHYPCVLASGGFQESISRSSFCKEHIYQVPLVCSADIDCHTCGTVGDIANLMTCCGCNAHHHGTCVGLPQLPGVRAGWNCKSCRVCQVCHGIGTDSGECRAISCEQCDKLYHAACIRPIMSTIPKYGWKCKCCRVCSDCGSRSPGAGASSRWHAHYTVCDSCYQQRNKGLSCPLCRRAYRAAAQREMVQCINCKRYVHGSCDPDADLVTYQQKRETIPEYDYVCPVCKSIANMSAQRRKGSIDEESLSASQESLFDDTMMDQDPLSFDTKMDFGLGKGKPFTATKIAKKKIGVFKYKSGGFCNVSGKLAFNKRQRGYFVDFGRKRGTKTKMRGIFGVPGVGLQKPQARENKGSDEEPGVENKLVLCSSKDKFVLTQDLCVMCGALGTDAEGCLIACAQCGQTYHPYCVSIKVTSVIIQKGWRCLDCTACEGCGRRDDEARLVLCDDCDVSYHTYCATPMLNSVPQGCWRCHRCRQCITCGTTQPGADMWMNGYTECGPCASLVMCAVCEISYGDGELIIQCTQCQRWLHAACDSIHNEKEADICCQKGYNCILCRPHDCPPPHLMPRSLSMEFSNSGSSHQSCMRPPSPGEYLLDGVCLSARGLRAMRTLQGDSASLLNGLQGRKKRRPRFEGPFDKNADILATIESVVHGDCDASNEDMKDSVDIKEEQGLCPYKEGMFWIVAQDGPPPEGFTLYTTENGNTVLRRKRQRNLNRVGIGGFNVRVRSQGRIGKCGENDLSTPDSLDPTTPTGNLESPTLCGIGLEKRKKPRRKPKSRLMESFPSYMQEAFFGRELLELPGSRVTDPDVSLPMSDSESEEFTDSALLVNKASTIHLNQEELLIMEATRVKEEKEKGIIKTELSVNNSSMKMDNELLHEQKSVVHNVKNLKDTLVLPNSVNIGKQGPENDQMIPKDRMPLNNMIKQQPMSKDESSSSNSDTKLSQKEDLSLLEVNIESLPNMDSRDVEEIFKGVLTDDSQESQESSVSFVNSVSGSSSYNPQRQQLSSPMEYPSPYHTEYSGSSQLSPAFSESSGHWSAGGAGIATGCISGISEAVTNDSSTSQPSQNQMSMPTTYNQRSTEKMKADEGLGSAATISAVLYANLNHPEWKTEYPNWPDRCKQILKKWRALASDKKTPYLQQARDNRGAIRMKKAQQITKESSVAALVGTTAAASDTPPAAVVAELLPTTLPDQQQQQSAEVPLEKNDGLDITLASATNTLTPNTTVVPSPPDSNVKASSPPTNTTATTTCSSVVTTGQFTLHHKFTPFYHHHPGTTGPAPNVTVNPFGKFTTAGGGAAHHHKISNLTLGIVQQAQAQVPAASIVRHNITGALFSHALSSFLGAKSHQHQQQKTLAENSDSRSSSPADVVSESAASAPSPSGDLHIRVLTPSEIMRTLPSMPQELAYEPPPSSTTTPQTTEQDKFSGQQRRAREAEQERQWKQSQQLRQQQAQHQQQVIHDQRLQAMARVQRQITTDGPFPQEQQQLQISINDQSPMAGMASPSPTTMPRSPFPPNTSLARFPHPALVQTARPPMQSPFSPQSPHDPQFPGSVSPAQQQQQQQNDPFQRPPSENSGDFLHSPQTPRSFGHQSPNQPARSPAYVPRVINPQQQESYAQAPGTPRPNAQYTIVPQRNPIYAPRPQDPFMPAQSPNLMSPRSEGPPMHQQQPVEVNRQLKDLLLRQNSGSQIATTKSWTQGEEQLTNQSVEQQQVTEGQFRQPLPVSPIVRNRPPVAVVENRTRLILQNPGMHQHQRMFSPMMHQQQLVNTGPGMMTLRTRMPMMETTNQSQNIELPNQASNPGNIINTNINKSSSVPLSGISTQVNASATTKSSAITQSAIPSQSTEEIPEIDNDKLEHDNTNIAEVGDLLGGLGDDEDELLVSLTAEIGDDFNILEYADPELADFGDTNILDGLELAEEENTQGKHVKRDPIDDTIDTKQTIKTEPRILKSEKREDNVSVKLELDENKSMHLQQHNTDIIENKPQQNTILSQNQLKFHQTFRAAHPQSLIQNQGKQIQQQTQFNASQKIVANRQTINVNQQGQFTQINKLVIGKHQNVTPNQNIVSTQQMLRQQGDQNQSTDQLNQQGQVHFVQQQQIRGQFVQQTQLTQQLQQQQQNVQQQMQSQVTAALALGRPMAPGTRLMSPDGAVGVVTANNTVTVTYPSGFQNRPPHNRMGILTPGLGIRGVVRPGPPPPPPYPGTQQRAPPPPPPPPPYPSQISLDASPHMYGVDPWSDWLRSRRPLLLQEQPLLLEDLLEQEKREQGRQVVPSVDVPETVQTLDNSSNNQQWQQTTPSSLPTQQSQVGSVPLYNMPHLPAPPLPPERIASEADRQAQLIYEQWLQQQNSLLTHQMKYYETEVQKFRKIRKSLNSKQRQLRKSGKELTTNDAGELARVSAEQAVLQKHLESARKQCRQHSTLIQEYRNKQQQQQQQSQAQQAVSNVSQQVNVSANMQQIQNLNNINQQQSVNVNMNVSDKQQQQQMSINTQQVGANQPPNQLNIIHQQQIATNKQQIVIEQHIQQSTQQQQMNVMQSPTNSLDLKPQQQHVNSGKQVNISQIGVSQQINIASQQQGVFNQYVLQQQQQQQSVLIQSQQQQQQSALIQAQQQQQQQANIQNNHVQQQQSHMIQQLNQQNQINQINQQNLISNQQIQNQINQQQQMIINQRINNMNQLVQQQSNSNQSYQQPNSPQLQQHQQIVQNIFQQNQSILVNQNQRPLSSPSPQMTVQLQQNMPSPVTSHSPQLSSIQSGGGASPHTGSTPPPSFSPQSASGGRSPQVVFPRPQGSPLQTRFVRPPTHHGIHQQGMRTVAFNNRQSSSPLGSPQPMMSPGASNDSVTQRQQMMQRQQYSPMGQPPSSPLSRSPLIGVQPPSSPLSARSPLISSHNTPSPSPQPDTGGGGGNPHAAHNPAPLPPGLFKYKYFKLGLRGGSPMWGHNKPIKRIISNEPIQSSSTQPDQIMKPRKESHINKVSILKKKTQPKISPVISQNIATSIKNASVSSLVNSEYNELDDSSCTPPISPGKIVQSYAEDTKSNEKPQQIKIKSVKPPVIEKNPEFVEDYVLIDSSPDESKQQIFDYDDENDKNFVGAEVSLCAAAADSDQGDMESFPPVEIAGIASSPLVSHEYLLFSSDVEYAVDSDDSLKQLSYIPKDDSVVIYSRQTSESNGESNHSPLEISEDENNCIHIEEKADISQNQSKLEEDLHESIDNEILVISSNVASPEEHIATEEDFEELIDSGKPEETPEEEAKEITNEKIVKPESLAASSTITMTENTKKTLAVISLTPKPAQSATNVNQIKIVNTGKSGIPITRLPVLSATVLSPKIEVSQATVASVSIANQTFSVPVLKTLNVPIVPLTSSGSGSIASVSHIKKIPITITTPSLNLPSKPIPSVISVISSNINPAPRMATLTIATTSNATNSPRMPIPILTQQHIKQKLVKALEKPTTLTISSSKLSTLSVTQDVTLPAKIFEDESASPDSSLSQDESNENENKESPVQKQKNIINILSNQKPNIVVSTQNIVKAREVDVENEIKHTEITKHIAQKNILAKLEIPPSNKISERIPDHIMEGDDEKSVKPDKEESKQIKEEKMPIDINVNTSDILQESVQLSIPSPQDKCSESITLQACNTNTTQKHIETYKDVYDMLNNMGQKSVKSKDEVVNKDNDSMSDITEIIHQDLNSANLDHGQESLSKSTTIPVHVIMRSRESSQSPITVATSRVTTIMPQLSPLSKPTELTTNIANASQQLRTIMSSINTSKGESIKKEHGASTQVNFENLLPSTKVEINTGKSTNRGLIEKAVLNCVNSSASENIAFSTRISTSVSSGVARSQPSPLMSPNISPRNSPLLSVKSPIHSPSPLTVVSQASTDQDQTSTNISSTSNQIIQMPALSKIQSQTISSVIQSSAISTKNQVAMSNILSSTLLQSNRPPLPSVNNNTQLSLNSLNTRPTTLMASNQAQNNRNTASSIMSSKLLHSQLTSPLKRSKSTDDPKSDNNLLQPNKRHSLESVIVKSEPMDSDESNVLQTENSGCKFSALNSMQKADESQNVLLKQLLQNSGGNSPTVAPRTSIPSLLGNQRTAPSLGLVSSLEAQLARPSIPPPHLPIVSTVEPAATSPRQPAEKLSFISRPPTSIVTHSTFTQSLIEVRKPSMKTTKEEAIVSTTPPVFCPSNENICHTIKKETSLPHQSPNQQFIPQEVKKELLDETSQQSAMSGLSTASDLGKLDTPIKEELLDSNMNVDTPIDNLTQQESALEAKKRKRREYQQKRRQMQNNQKIEANNNKKRPRKCSRVDEDYDTFIDNLMVQLRQLPPMQVQEPQLGKNYGVCPVFGSGDLTKIGSSRDYSIKSGDLTGDFGNARIPNTADFYNTKPFGEDEPIPDKPPISTQRGFYDQEFSPIRLDTELDDKKIEYICKERDIDTPDTIVSSSSPECASWDRPFPFPGLKLIDELDSDEEHERSNSPIVPIVTPIPIRLKPLFKKEVEKENISNKDGLLCIKSKINNPSEENVTVTLTLTSGAAEDIIGVLRELAGILHIPPPTSYQIVERTTTPPSHKLGLYRSKGKDGKEGTPVDIQSILNGAAKFCRHCDVVILDSVVRARASEFPLLSSSDLLNDGESDLYFCSTQCYKRFAWTPTNILIDGGKTTKSEIIPNVDIKAKVEYDIDDIVDIKPNLKDEKMDLSFIDSIDNEDLMRNETELLLNQDDDSNLDIKPSLNSEGPPSKMFRGMQYKFYLHGCIGPPTRYRRPSDREITDMIFRAGVTVMPKRIPEDTRQCSLCHTQGDGVADGPSRLLNYDVDKWVHLNCALWSDSVYETENGALMNFDNALQACSNAVCVFCERIGATVRCFKTRCSNMYHLNCAIKDKCVFHKNKTTHCPSHIPKNEKENELTTLSVQRRVYVQRDESRQVAAVMQLGEPTHLLRVGSLIFLSVGQLLPHQLAAFHTPHFIYPIGYQIVRFYWSTTRLNSRCRYICSIGDKGGRPEFIVTPQESEPCASESRGGSPRAAWAPLLTALANMRSSQDTLRLWPDYLTGEDLFGLTEPAIVRVLESLPGIDTLSDYRFKYGRNPLLELPLAVNPSGAARTEPRATVKGAQWRRALAVRAPPSALRAPPPPLAPPPPPGEHACPYSKQFVHSKSSQYKKMKQEWRNNVYLARSKIQGLGLYAARDLEKNTMVIEYIGEVIRRELSEIREKQYEARNRGIYMFRLDEERIIDATLCGGLARYINHSCNPNCVAEAVEVERDVRIIIFAKRKIIRGEELAYDYLFEIEDDAHKISCMCGAPNCRKWMN